jgi:hypothetical protein
MFGKRPFFATEVHRHAFAITNPLIVLQRLTWPLLYEALDERF